MDKTFRDMAKCPKHGRTFVIYRRTASAGKVVATWCIHCRTYHKLQAGVPPSTRKATNQ